MSPHHGVAFFNILKDIEEESEMRIFDMWMIYTATVRGKTKKRLRALVMKMFHNGVICQNTIAQSISRFGSCLESSFSSMLQLGRETLVSQKFEDSRGRQFGASLLYELYNEFTLPVFRQDIVAALCAHAGSRASGEVDGALSVLLAISKREYELALLSERPSGIVTSALFIFLPFLSGLVDDLPFMSEEQQRKYFHCLFCCFLCKAAGERMSSRSSTLDFSTSDIIPDDLSILLRKYIASGEEKLRRIAVVAYVSQIEILQRQSSATGTASDPTLLQYLEKVISCCSFQNCQGQKFLYNELSRSVAQGLVTSIPLLEKLKAQAENEVHNHLGNHDERGSNRPSTHCKSGNIRIETKLYFDLNHHWSDVYVELTKPLKMDSNR